jgi:protein O-mannosyl-transferase
MTESPIQPDQAFSPRVILISASLIVVTLAVYSRAIAFGFVDLDDIGHVAGNPHVMGGLTIENIVWAFTTDFADYWRPVTWLSFMLDVELHGGKPSGFHLTNIILHAINTVLMFLFWRRATGALWPPALIAGWFALHPMHVESVVWITERKDVLCVFFWLLTMLSYLSWVRAGGVERYVLMLMLFALALMSKPLAVMLPVVLLLMDIWPLNRWKAAEGSWTRAGVQLLVEKLPLLAMSLASGVLTMIHGASAMPQMSKELQLSNAAVSCVRYIVKMLWPTDMAVYYSFPGLYGHEPWSTWQVIGSIVIILALTALAVRLLFSAQRWYTVGWLWYLITLLPVVGVFQVGDQSIADRFTYVPYIGLFIILAFGGAKLVTRAPMLRVPLAALAAITVVGCAMVTWNQLGYWHDTDSLYGHVLAVTRHNMKIHDYYGQYLVREKRLAEAEVQYRAAVECLPDNATLRFKYGYLLLENGSYTEAIEQFEHAVRIDPSHAFAHYNLGLALAKRFDYPAAIEHVEAAIRLSPDNAEEFERTLKMFKARQGR